MTQEEFKYIFDHHFDSVRNYIYYRCGDSELATDVAQDTFMKIWEKQKFDLKRDSSGLLYKIASDLFVSSYRKAKVAQNFTMKFEHNGESLSPEDELNYQETKRCYESALANMPEKQRVVFLMSRMEELKYFEIAERLNLSVKAVEKRMKNALSGLRKALKN